MCKYLITSDLFSCIFTAKGAAANFYGFTCKFRVFRDLSLLLISFCIRRSVGHQVLQSAKDIKFRT